MNDVIQFGESRKTMSSLDIANITGRQHKDVMRAIRNMEPAWERFNGRKFALDEYTDAKGEKRPCYLLDKTECLFIATKFNDEARAKLVLRWKELEEEKLQPKTGAEMLLLYAQQMVEQERRINEIEGKQNLLEQKIVDIEQRTDTNIRFTTIVGFANRFGMRCPVEQASVLGKKAVGICKKFGYNTGKIPDPRFGMVRTYPDDVLIEVFEEYYPNMNFRQ